MVVLELKRYVVWCIVVSKPERKKTKEADKKPMYLKDYERKQLMERGVMAGVSDSEEEEEEEAKSKKVNSYNPAV